MMVSSMVGCLGGGGGLFPMFSNNNYRFCPQKSMLKTPLLLLLIGLASAGGKLDGTPIRYGSLLRIKSSQSGH
jgi:hypothetical protein